MTMTMDEFQKILDETYDRHFGDFMKIVNEVERERNKDRDRLGKDIKPESKGQNR